MTTLKETLNLLSDKLLSEVVTELTEKVHSLQLENAVLKSKNFDLLEKQRTHEETMLTSTRLIKSLRSEVSEGKNMALNLKYENEQLQENNQQNLDIIDSLKTEYRGKENEMQTIVAALRSENAAKSHTINVIKTKKAAVEGDLEKLRSEAALNEKKVKSVEKWVIPLMGKDYYIPLESRCNTVKFNNY